MLSWTFVETHSKSVPVVAPITEMKKISGNVAGSVPCMISAQRTIQHPIRNENTVPTKRSARLTLTDSVLTRPSEYALTGYSTSFNATYFA